MKLPKGLGDINSLMKQAKEAMEKAKNLEEELKLLEVEATKNGVTVKFNGSGDLLSFKVSPEIVDPNDIETLEDAVIMAFREGQEKSNELKQQKVREITGDLPIPPGMGM